MDNAFCGFGNFFQSEAIAGALPLNQNSPQQVPFQLYAEQVSGSAFTCPRDKNHYIWLYRCQPSVVHQPQLLYKEAPFFSPQQPADPNQMRFDSFREEIDNSLSFVEGLTPVASNDCARSYLYQVSQSESKQFMVNNDGEFLIVPQHGDLTIHTELGVMKLTHCECAVIPRGIKFQVVGYSYGYICESLQGRFQLPNLGPIGSNGLANPHDFIHPQACYNNAQGDYEVITLYQNHLWRSHFNYHPLNVVAWKGNYLPYQYDLRKFNTINTVSFDHPDPSIFTVLTVPSLYEGTANIDFVIFPERWMVAENTFRPPYFHKNVMSELMGLIKGKYDAKETGFLPGSISIHNCMSAHGPDADTYNKAINNNLQPERYQETLAFMFECRLPWNITNELASSSKRQLQYQDCWQALKNQFDRG